MQDLRNALYAHLQRLPLRFFTETRTGEIQSRLANDVGGIQSVVTDTASSVFSQPRDRSSRRSSRCSCIDWRLTLLSLGLLPFFMYLTYRVGKVRREHRARDPGVAGRHHARSPRRRVSVSGMLLTKTFGQQAAAVDRFRDANAKLATLQIRQAMVGRWFFMIVGTIFSITPALVYWLAGYLAINGDAIGADDRRHRRLHDAPDAAVLPARPAAQRAGRGPGRAGAVRPDLRVPRPADPRSRTRPTRSTLEPATVRGRIRFRHVCFRYRRAAAPKAPTSAAVEPSDGADVGRRSAPSAMPATSRSAPPSRERCPFGLQDIDFEAEPGQLVALVGPSGSGKTTTTYLLPRLYDVDDGRGRDRRHRRAPDAPGRRWASVIGFVTQETFLFHATRAREPALRPPDATDAELEAAARAAAIHDRDHGACPRATTRSSASAATSCPAARSSASRSPGCCSRTRAS